MRADDRIREAGRLLTELRAECAALEERGGLVAEVALPVARAAVESAKDRLGILVDAKGNRDTAG